MQLTEKYRPKCWDEVIGQEKVVKSLLALKARDSLAGRAFWISGKSGCGKSSIARLIAADIADPFMVREVDATGLTVAGLRELEEESTVYGWGERTGRAFIVNEAHGLRRDVIRQFLVALERIPGHVCWIFTTTKENEATLFEDCNDASPLLSRCLPISLTIRGVNPVFAKRLQEIALAENLDGKPYSAYLRLIEDEGGNLRAGLQAIEAGRMLP